MSEALSTYLSELAYLRRMGAAFARRHPKVAARLQLEANECADPHVERLLEGFAMLTGRLHDRIDSGHGRIAETLLDILYPQLTTTVPSMAIARFGLSDKASQMTTAYNVPRHTRLVTGDGDHACRFLTGAPLELWPLDVAQLALVSPNRFLCLDGTPDVGGVLHLTLAVEGDSLPELELDRLRFFINGDRAAVPTLVDLLFRGLRGVVLLPDGDEQRAVWLAPEALTHVGFDQDEALLPYPDTAHAGYRLLQEYFHFPQKFQFFEVSGLARRGRCQQLEILFLFDRNPGNLYVDRNTLCLGSVPVINLFEQTSDPIRIDHTDVAYSLEPDSVRRRTTEIHSVSRVSRSPLPDQRDTDIPPYFGYRHYGDQGHASLFYTLKRRACFQEDMPGTEMMLSLVDLGGAALAAPSESGRDMIVYAHTLCTNRELAAELAGGTPLVIDRPSPLAAGELLTKPTLPGRPQTGKEGVWRLISQLSLNYLSLQGETGLAALKEMLALYAPADSAHAERQIRGLRGFASRPATAHLGDAAWRGFCRGLRLELAFDESFYTGTGFYLFGAVLNHFFGLYASVNAFTQLAAHRVNREHAWHVWRPRAGAAALI
ncbi:type VI secretion system baseplate subunit TssF [Acanthopleuribacter pedis]|uniref:Type VI secretion system baseplate subunit TssF n=1 Tax=Acanthopleuribacter pedis TaxID=442870 RepID=A0A8J7U435_9BACT|nr:type VI secretion system baseplate subunit TssF [Acanthopleuribacter pedis]MBO1321078.1 type VI secretion system baseplate subunit TssF [Acanthopleuribacter pedis]